MAAGKGCSSCSGTLPKKCRVVMLEHPSGWVAHDFWALTSSTAAPEPKLRGSIFLFPERTGNRDAVMSIPSRMLPSSSTTPRDIFPSYSQNPKLTQVSLLLPQFLSSLGSWHELHHGRWELPPAAGWRKREGRRWDHATSCSRRLLQTFLQHIQPHGTFCVTKASKNINHQN